MLIATEGWREILISTLILGGLSVGAFLITPWMIAPFVILWIWVLAFFRDPPRQGRFAAGELCSPADGTVTEISELDHHEGLNGPAIRIGIFLSLFNVHVNRMSCTGRVRSLAYEAGEFLDARHPESGKRNEQNALLIDPDPPLAGPVEIRQIAGLVARRIICHARANDHYKIGARFGLIKFGSRTELVIPQVEGTELMIKTGDRVHAGLTVLVRQPVSRGTESGESGVSSQAVSTGGRS